MAVVPKLTFTKDWTNVSNFPTTETRENVVREDMQYLFDEIRDYINNTLVGEGGGGVLTASGLPFSSTRSIFENCNDIKSAIEKVLDIAQQVVELSIGEEAVGHENLQNSCVWNSNIADGTIDLTSKVYGLLPLANGGLAADLTTAAGKGAARNALGLSDYATLTTPVPLNKGGLAVDLSTTAGKATARSNLGLGSCATQNTLAIANGGTGATSAAAARTNLGLGSCATQNTLAIANGGTGATSAAAARNNLGLGNTTGALPVANGGTGANNATAARSNLGAQQQVMAVTTAQFTVGTSVVEVAVSGVTADTSKCHVVVSPNESYFTAWQNGNVRCTGQVAGKLRFQADASVSVKANVLIFITQ